MIPWKGAEGWRDEAGWGEMVLDALWGGSGGERRGGEGQRIAGVIEPEDWEVLSNFENAHKGWIFMERGMCPPSHSSLSIPSCSFLRKDHS